MHSWCRERSPTRCIILDLSAFDAHYSNDETGAPAHSPAMLLRAVLLGYSQGLVSSRAPDTTLTRQFAVLIKQKQASYADRMRQRIDSDVGRALYGRRLGIVEPVFGNIRYNKRIARFTLRGRTKVDGQWKLFALVHNIEKLAKRRKVA